MLVDDVLTTGSTLREAANTLETAGFQVRSAVVLAAARAPDPGRKNLPTEGLAENTFRQKMNKRMQ
jgi:adenine/guanine phosphoribosyltransferase-like PRPP-binding protein